MSVVTNVIVTLDTLCSDFIVDRLNTWLRLTNRHSSLLRVDENSGGEKHFEAHVYLGAFNYFDSEGFLAFCKSIEVKYKRSRISPIHFSIVCIPDIQYGDHYFTKIGERY